MPAVYSVGLQDACCGRVEACTQRHLYCFNRIPKEADVSAMHEHQAKINGATHGSAPESFMPTLAEMTAFVGTDKAFPVTAARTAQPERHMMLSGDSKARKATPICEGVIDYFPLALAAIARLSKSGNDKHNPGQPLHWSRDKSTDHADCIVRHLIDRGTIDPDSGELHDVGLAWRALANLQLAEEKRLAAERGA